MFKLNLPYRIVLALFLLLASLGALAAERSFPAGTRRGMLDMSGYPQILIDGRVRQTVPGTRIYNEENLFVTPNMLSGSRIAINYIESDYGDVEKIWILTPEEMRKELPKAEVWKPMQFKNPTFN